MSGNFAFLARHDPLFVQLAEAAERNRHLVINPSATLLQFRRLARRGRKPAGTAKAARATQQRSGRE